MTEVKFSVYRNFVASRTEANNAMIALLAGSRIGEHTLHLTSGSELLLPNVFPAVPHISRLNLKTDAAQAVLRQADSHLAVVAVPYALSIHEHFVMSCLEWLQQIERLSGKKYKNATPKNMHETLFECLGEEAPTELLASFHLLRSMRNAQIHAGGQVGSELEEAIEQAGLNAAEEWLRLAGRSPAEVQLDGSLRFDVGDIIAAFATSKALGRRVNSVLGESVEREHWAEAAVKDFQDEQGSGLIWNSSTWHRKCKGFTRRHYKALDLSDNELTSAAASLQLD